MGHFFPIEGLPLYGKKEEEHYSNIPIYGRKVYRTGRENIIVFYAVVATENNSKDWKVQVSRTNRTKSWVLLYISFISQVNDKHIYR